MSIVESFDVFKDGMMQFLVAMIGSSVGFFMFEVFEETFTAGIIKRISFLGKQLYDIEFESNRKETDIIYLGTGSEDEFCGVNVKGKIVLCDIYFKTSHPRDLLNLAMDAEIYDPRGLTYKPLNKYDIYTPNSWPYNYERAMEKGAIGFVGILHNYMDCWYYHEDYKDIVHIDGYMELPAVWISKSDGENLKQRITHGYNCGYMDVRTDYTEKTAKIVSALLKGQSDDIVLVHSYHDAFSRGAVQDALGMSVVFALADFFTKLPVSLRGKTLMFLATDSHFTDYEGQVGFIRNRKKAGDRLVYDFAIEHVAKEMELGEDNSIIMHDEPETRMLYVDRNVPGLLELVRDAVAKYDLEKTAILPSGKSGGDYTSDDVCSDAYDFSAEEIPVVSLVAGPMYLFHYSDDIDKVDRESLMKIVGMYAYLIINTIQN